MAEQFPLEHHELGAVERLRHEIRQHQVRGYILHLQLPILDTINDKEIPDLDMLGPSRTEPTLLQHGQHRLVVLADGRVLRAALRRKLLM
jgi:hypothetical protein